MKLSFPVANFLKRAAKDERLLRSHISLFMEYAKNFKRPGIETNEDLLWFSKLENHRLLDKPAYDDSLLTVKKKKKKGTIRIKARAWICKWYK